MAKLDCNRKHVGREILVWTFFGKYNQPHKKKDIQLVLGVDGEVVFEGCQWALGVDT